MHIGRRVISKGRQFLEKESLERVLLQELRSHRLWLLSSCFYELFVHFTILIHSFLLVVSVLSKSLFIRTFLQDLHLMLLKAKVLTSETPQPNISGTYRVKRHYKAKLKGNNFSIKKIFGGRKSILIDQCLCPFPCI